MNKQEKSIIKTVKEFVGVLPKFPDGRINYSNAKEAPVLTCFVKFKDKILLLKRSNNVRTYKGKWNAIAGYLDDLKPFKEKIMEELREELSIDKKIIKNIKIGNIYEFHDKKIDKKWIVHTAIVELKQKPIIKLDREHTDFKWIEIKEIKKYDAVPMIEESLKSVLG